MSQRSSNLERMIYDQLVCSKEPESIRNWIPLTISKDSDLVGAPIQPGFIYAILLARPTTWWHSENSDLQIQWQGGFADLYLTRTGRIVVYASFRQYQRGYYLVDESRYEEPFDNREWSPAGDDIRYFLPCICVDWRTAWLSLAQIFMNGKIGDNSPWVALDELERRFGNDQILFNAFEPPFPEPLYWGP